MITAASSGPIAERIDEMQAAHSGGPCLEAAWDQQLMRIDDYRDENRWPLYVADVVESTPVRSTVSFELYRRQSAMGALNVHSRTPHAFDSEAIDLGKTFATQAALAVHSEWSEQQFLDALASRDVIGQAKGMLMEQYSIDADRAFDLLRKLSMDSNIKLVTLARRLVAIDHPPSG